MKISAMTDIGSVRKQNQDAFWFRKISENLTVAVVCDGMGGARGGSHASSLATKTVEYYLDQTQPLKDIQHAFKEIIEFSNKNVYDTAFSNDELAGMGTTMVLAAVQNQTVHFANVGDSRGYHITNGGIHQITKDHSAVQELIDGGHITERQAKIHPNKNIITRAIGVEDTVEFDYFSVDAAPGDIIVLCTDGLTNHVDENEIQFEASGGAFEDLPQRLIDLANNRGGTDNITVVAIRI